MKTSVKPVQTSGPEQATPEKSQLLICFNTLNKTTATSSVSDPCSWNTFHMTVDNDRQLTSNDLD